MARKARVTCMRAASIRLSPAYIKTIFVTTPIDWKLFFTARRRAMHHKWTVSFHSHPICIFLVSQRRNNPNWLQSIDTVRNEKLITSIFFSVAVLTIHFLLVIFPPARWHPGGYGRSCANTFCIQIGLRSLRNQAARTEHPTGDRSGLVFEGAGRFWRTWGGFL